MDDADLAYTVIRRPTLEPPGAVTSLSLEGVEPLVLPPVQRADVDGDTIVREPGRVIVGVDEMADEPHPPQSAANGPRISINGAAPSSLDVPRIFGRNPRLPRVVSGPAPLLVILDSAHGEVSGTHLELTRVGNSVVVTDLRSTNGTVVVLPGAVRMTMRSGDSIVAVPGTIIELGDGNRIEILPPPRLAAPASDRAASDPAASDRAASDPAASDRAASDRAGDGYPVGESIAGEFDR